MIIGIASAVPIAINKVLLTKNRVTKVLGVIFTIGILGVTFFMTLVNAALLDLDKGNIWGAAYAFSFLLDLFFTQMLVTFIKVITSRADFI